MGAGKSTFVTLLQNYIHAHLILEPHHMWQDVGGENLLDAFYKQPDRWAYSFQTYAFVTRVLEQERAMREHPHIPLFFLERSVFSDRYCFAKNAHEMGLMTDLEWSMYTRWFEWLVDQYATRPSAFVYLQADPEVCYARMHKRNRDEEGAVPLSYVQRLHDKHEEWLIGKQGVAPYLHDIPVLVVSCNEDFEHNIDHQRAIVRKLATFLEQQFSLAPHTTLRQYDHVFQEEVSCQKMC